LRRRKLVVQLKVKTHGRDGGKKMGRSDSQKRSLRVETERVDTSTISAKACVSIDWTTNSWVRGINSCQSKLFGRRGSDQGRGRGVPPDGENEENSQHLFQGSSKR